jgi:zinc transport system permease protein
MDLLWLLGISLFIGVLCLINWRSWLLLTLDEDLAQTAGISSKRHRLLFICSIAFLIAVGMKIVGALLLPALLILPAATVSRLSKSPEQMVLFSVIFLLVCYFLGFYASFQLDTPTGPTIVMTSIVVFLLGMGLGVILPSATI